MTVYASTACLAGANDLWEILDAYRAAGMRAIELGWSKVDESGAALAGRLGEQDLDFAVHNYFPPPHDAFVLNLASPDPAIAERSLAFVLGTLELAAGLDAPVYSIHGGFVTDPVGFDGTSFVFPEPDSPHAAEQAQERFAEAVRRVVKRAEELSVRLLVENNVCSERHVGKLLLQRTEEFTALFDAVGSPSLGILVDFGHLNVTARVLGFDRLELITALAPHVGGFHVHDNDGRADRHLPVEPDSWVVEVLRRPEFAGLPTTVEAKFESAQELAGHVRWLEREIAAGTVRS